MKIMIYNKVSKHLKKIKGSLTENDEDFINFHETQVYYLCQPLEKINEIIVPTFEKDTRKNDVRKAFRSMPFDKIFIEGFYENGRQTATYIVESGPSEYLGHIWISQDLFNLISFKLQINENDVSIQTMGLKDDAALDDYALLDHVTTQLAYIQYKNVIHGEEQISNFKKRKMGKKCPKPITYITQKRMDKKYEPTVNSSRVKWHHSWRVSGHWRKIGSVGKDRDGNYGIPGFTWIQEHLRGEGEVVEKIKVVRS